MTRKASRGHVPRDYVRISDDESENTFYLNTETMDERGDCPVIVLGPGLDGIIVADSFVAFVERSVRGDPLDGLH
jgi:hypothetical protein